MPDLSNTPDDAGKHAAAHALAPAEIGRMLDADPLALCGTCEGSGEDGHDEWGCRTDCPDCDGDGWAR